MGVGIFPFYLPFLPQLTSAKCGAELGNNHVCAHLCLWATNQAQNLGLWPIHKGNRNEISLVQLHVCSIAFSSEGLGGFVWNNLGQLHFVGKREGENLNYQSYSVWNFVVWNIWDKDTFRFCFRLVGVRFHHLWVQAWTHSARSSAGAGLTTKLAGHLWGRSKFPGENSWSVKQITGDILLLYILVFWLGITSPIWPVWWSCAPSCSRSSPPEHISPAHPELPWVSWLCI